MLDACAMIRTYIRAHTHRIHPGFHFVPGCPSTSAALVSLLDVYSTIESVRLRDCMRTGRLRLWKIR